MFVALHIHAAAAKNNFLTLEAKALLEGVIAAEFDLAAGTQNAMPGQINGSMESPRHQPGTAAKSGGASDRTVGGDFAARDGANQRQNFLTVLFSD
jgi:hypothetical protein